MATIQGIQQITRQPDRLRDGHAGHPGQVLPKRRALLVGHDVVDQPLPLARIARNRG